MGHCLGTHARDALCSHLLRLRLRLRRRLRVRVRVRVRAPSRHLVKVEELNLPCPDP